MLMLDICPTSRSGAAGFTIIEIMVVLLLLSLATAVALPNLSRIYENFQQKNIADEITQRLESLPLQAYVNQTDFSLNADNVTELLSLPAHWQAVIERPIHYKASGVCTGGEISFSAQSIVHRYLLAPPYCKMTVSQ